LTGAERGRVGKSRDRTLFQINGITEMEMLPDQAALLTAQIV